MSTIDELIRQIRANGAARDASSVESAFRNANNMARGYEREPSGYQDGRGRDVTIGEALRGLSTRLSTLRRVPAEDAAEAAAIIEFEKIAARS